MKHKNFQPSPTDLSSQLNNQREGVLTTEQHEPSDANLGRFVPVGGLALAVTFALGAGSPGSAAANTENSRAADVPNPNLVASHTSRAEKPPTGTARIPRLAPGASVKTAKSLLLRGDRFKYAGTVPRKSQVDPNKKIIATGYAKKVTKMVRREGDLVKKVTYKTIAPGTRKRKGSAIYIRTKQVPKTNITNPTYDDTPAIVPPTAPPPITAPAGTPLNVAAEVQKHLQSETVYVPYSNCSGAIVRNTARKAIAVATALHCGFTSGNMPRITGSDGKLYSAMNNRRIMQGENTGSMSTIAYAEKLIAPPASDPSHDLALLKLEGSGASDQEVVDAYNAKRLSDSELAALPVGTVIESSGFPVTQPENTTGGTKRVSFELGVLGTVSTFNSNGQSVPAFLWTGMKAGVNTTICSYGDSGAVGYNYTTDTRPDGVKYVKFSTVGVLSGFDDFRKANEGNVDGKDGSVLRDERESTTGFDLDNTDATCQYDNQKLSEDPDAINLKDSYDQLP